MNKNWQSQRKIYALFCLMLLSCSSGTTVNSQTSKSQTSKVVSQAEISSTSRGQMLPITAQAIIKEQTIALEVAETPAQQAMGLMFREALPDNRGMFFPFPQARIARFWMNNVPVPLDMIFIKENKVIAIASSVPPCQTKPEDCPLYGPNIAVDGVIELRSGTARELGLTIGDPVKIEFLDTLQQN